MSSSLDECLKFTLQEEGSFVDNPKDPGGATNMGITLATLRVWRDDPHLGVADVKALTVTVATSIYGADYWNKLRCDALPAGIDLMAFDFAVTSGTLRSAKLLQAAVGADDDGSIGPDTLAAAARSDHAAVVTILAARQAQYYGTLNTFPVFGKGWLARTGRRKNAALGMMRVPGAVPVHMVGQPMQQSAGGWSGEPC